MDERVSTTQSKNNSSTATHSSIGQSNSQISAPGITTHRTTGAAQIAQSENFEGEVMARCGHRATHRRTSARTRRHANDGISSPPLQAGVSFDQPLGVATDISQARTAGKTEQRLEVADIFRSLNPSVDASLSPEQRRVVQDIIKCRTAALDGHIKECNHCGHRQNAYNSCRNRHCPKCQGAVRAKWLDMRKEELLPVDYYHVVFALPKQLSQLALQNQLIIYRLLFKAASETLIENAADPQYFGAEIGFLAALHTWGQALQYHPHLHCVVLGGGLSLDHSKWVACHNGSFLQKKALSSRFRRKFISDLRKMFDKGKLRCEGRLSYLKQNGHFEKFLYDLNQIKWKVYSGSASGGPEQVLKYLARYINRVAISNQRLLELTDDKVTFSREGYAAGDRTKLTTLAVAEFTRRFLLHVLPKGFKAIRQFGFLANRCRQKKLDLCRRLLLSPASAPPPNRDESGGNKDQSILSKPALCPVCQQGRMIIIEKVMPITGCTNKNQVTDSS